jgi:hypothetical protein
MNIDRAMLEHSYQQTMRNDQVQSRMAYLASNIFGFTTYDDSAAELFARKALEVCAAITRGKTFDYIKDADNYCWYLVMVNMPFFAERLNWGSSIRGAWWDHHLYQLDTCGLWRGEEQVIDPDLTRDEWMQFIEALIEFAGSAPADGVRADAKGLKR